MYLRAPFHEVIDPSTDWAGARRTKEIKTNTMLTLKCNEAKRHQLRRFGGYFRSKLNPNNAFHCSTCRKLAVEFNYIALLPLVMKLTKYGFKLRSAIKIHK